MKEAEGEVANRLGLHARAASRFVQLANSKARTVTMHDPKNRRLRFIYCPPFALHVDRMDR